MTGKFLISEIAKRYKISRPTLIYYDNIELLSPTHDERTGYRYYSYRDLEKLELILTLKASGLSLKAIKTFMEDPSHEESIELLSKQKVRIDEKVKELKQLQLVLDKQIDLIKDFQSVELYDGIKLDFYPQMTLCKVDLNYENDEPLEVAIKTLKTQLDSSPLSYGSIPSKYSYAIDYYDLMDDNYNKYKYVSYISSHALDHMETVEAEANHYVRLLHHGPYDQANESFKRLKNFILINSYRIIGDAHIVPLVDLWAAKSKENFISELLIPVEI